MYFNARFFVKALEKNYTKRYQTEYLNRNNWWIEHHGKQVNDGIIQESHGLISYPTWESKTKPTPLSAAEIKKFRGDLL